MSGIMSLPLFADGVSRNWPPEFAHCHGVPGTTHAGVPSKDASKAICGAAPLTQRGFA